MVYRKADKPLNLKHRSLREKDVPVYLGEIRVPDDKNRPGFMFTRRNFLSVILEKKG